MLICQMLQVYDAAMLANGTYLCLAGGPSPMPPQNFSEMCKYSGDADFFGEPHIASRASWRRILAVQRVYIARADHPWPFIGEYASFPAGLRRACCTPRDELSG